jgi:hypothetical protein
LHPPNQRTPARAVLVRGDDDPDNAVWRTIGVDNFVQEDFEGDRTETTGKPTGEADSDDAVRDKIAAEQGE